MRTFCSLLTTFYVLFAVLTSSTGLLRRIFRQKSNRIQDLANDNIDIQMHSIVLGAASSSSSSSQTNLISSASPASSDYSINGAVHPDDSHLHHQPAPCTSRKEIIFCFYQYLRLILKEIIEDIASIQVELARMFAFKSSENIKDKVVELRKALRSICSQIRKVKRNHIALNNSCALIAKLAEQQKKTKLVFNETKVCQHIGAFRLKFVFADMIYQVLHEEMTQLFVLSDGVSQPQPRLNGFVTSGWIKERGQDIIDYYASVNKRN